MRKSKPIKVFYSEMSGRFYASRAYKEVRASSDRIIFVITGEKFDVTDDIGYAVTHFDIEFSEIEE